MKRFICILLMLAPGLAMAVPKIQHWTSESGARIYFTPAPEIPIVDVRVVFDAGSARDQELAGLSALTNGLLAEGAGTLDANTISERLESVGAQLGSGVLRDMAWLSMRSLSEKKTMDEAMGILSLILSKPTFPEKSFQREKKRMLVGLRASKQQPSDIADKAFMRAVYGSHPYASPPDGTEKSIKQITLKDLRGFYQQYYGAKNAVVAIVGDLSRSQAEALAKRLLHGLNPGVKASPLPKVEPVKKAVTIHVDHPSTQTHVWAGQPGVIRGDPDYFTLYVGNHTLGGSGLISLLSQEVREKRGFAYSVYSYFLPMRQAGPFQMALQTKSQHAENALDVLRQTVKKFIKSGISEKQLKASKQNITGGFALRLDSNKKLAQYLAMIGFYGLPLDYLNTFNSKIEAVTVKQINDAFRRRVDLSKMVTVTVGPEAVATK